jgi:hypothetical protein
MERQNIMVEEHGRGKLLAQHVGQEKKRERKVPGSLYSLQGHSPDDLHL